MKNNFRNIILVLLQFCFYFDACCQNFEWLNTFGTRIHNESIAGVKSYKSGGYCALVTSDSVRKLGDTLKFGKFQFITSVSNQRSQYLVVCNDSGTVTDAKDIGNFYAVEMCGDDNDNLYLSGQINKNNSISGQSLAIGKGRVLFAKYNKKLQLQWVTQTSDSVGATQPIRLVQSSGHLYFVIWLNGNSEIGGNIFNLWPNGGEVIGELDTNNGGVIWSKCPYAFIATSKIRIMDMLFLKNRLYYTGVTGFADKVILNSDTIPPNSGFIVQNSMNGFYQKSVVLRTKGSLSGGDYGFWPISLVSDGKDVFLSGSFIDSVYWFNDTISPGFISGSKKREIFMAGLTSTLQPKWFYVPKVKNQLGSQFSGISRSLFWKGNLYFGGKMEYKAELDSNIIDNGINKNNLILIKTDVNGNILWSVGGGKYSNIVYLNGVGNANHFYCGGGFKDSITFIPHTATSKGFSDAFIVKISDNTITRGTVSPGPYCAGDTFSIPFTKEGNFDSLNYFIAELSDENGNFDKTVRRLGVLKTNKDSVIKGVLPLFQVQSSPNYRIRIRSTRPAVTSFYKLDTLKLLVYSRDKAYAGKDTAICPGDSITLRTYGGTKWEWSPKENMQDSTKSSTLVWPTKTTRYRIVIADSSGCGEADTAFKTIILRYPKATLNTTDTTVCKGDTLKLTAIFTSGDSSGYSWRWQSKETGAWVNQSAGQKQQTANWNYAYKQDTAITLRLLLSDGCPKPQDTTEVLVGPKSPLKLTVPTLDTILCAGVPFTAKSYGQGGDPLTYKFQWELEPNKTIISNADTIHWLPPTNSQLQVTLSDACMDKADTQYIQISIREPLQATSDLKDTTLCYGQTLNYTAAGQGGDTAKHTYSWLLDGQQIGTGTILAFDPQMHFDESGGSKTLELIFSDGCSLKSDTEAVKITILPKLELSITSKDTMCFGESSVLHAQSQGGTGKYSVQWQKQGGQILVLSDSLLLQHNQKQFTGTQSFIAILGDGCSQADTVQFDVEFLAPLTVNILANDSCLREGTNLQATAQGGKLPRQIQWFQEKIAKGVGNTLSIPLPNKETNYTAVATDGCSLSSDTAKQRVSPYPKVTLTSNHDSGCEALNMRFTVQQLNATANQYRYSIAGSTSSWRADSIYSYTLGRGAYNLILEAKTSLGCVETIAGKEIQVFARPKSAYTYTPARPVPKSPEITLKNLSTGAVQYEWDFGKYGKSRDKDPKVKMWESGTHGITLISISDKGCRDTIAGTVRVYDDYSVWLPNAFTPNEDNLNELFEPVMQGVEKYQLDIYTRWGEKIYSGENTGWDGRYNGKLVPEGLYIYHLKITTINFDKVQEKGTMMVLRGK